MCNQVSSPNLPWWKICPFPWRHTRSPVQTKKLTWISSIFQGSAPGGAKPEYIHGQQISALNMTTNSRWDTQVTACTTCQPKASMAKTTIQMIDSLNRLPSCLGSLPSLQTRQSIFQCSLQMQITLALRLLTQCHWYSFFCHCLLPGRRGVYSPLAAVRLVNVPLVTSGGMQASGGDVSGRLLWLPCCRCCSFHGVLPCILIIKGVVVMHEFVWTLRQLRRCKQM